MLLCARVFQKALGSSLIMTRAASSSMQCVQPPYLIPITAVYVGADVNIAFIASGWRDRHRQCHQLLQY